MNTKQRCWIVIVCLVLLAACGGGGNASDSSQPAAPTKAVEADTTPELTAQDYIEEGLAYSDVGKYDEALTSFQAALDLEPDNPDAHRNLGSMYMLQEQWQKAVAAYEQAIAFAPEFGEAYGDVTWAYINLGRLEDAIASGETAIQLAPDYAAGFTNLAIAYKESGRINDAIVQYETAFALAPEDALPHYNLAILYEGQGMADEALSEYLEAIRLDPNHVKSRDNLALLYYNLGEVDQAIAEWEEAVRVDPNHANARKNLGLVYMQVGRNAEAIVEFEAYLDLIPADAPERPNVEAAIADLQNAASAPEQHQSASGGYAFPAPQGWYYEEEGALVRFGETAASLATAPEQAPLILFQAGPLNEVAADFGIAANSEPAAFVQAMAEALNVQVVNIEPGQLSGYPAAVADITTESPVVQGVISIVVVDGRGVSGIAMAPEDQWDDLRPIFLSMFQGLSFFLPEYSNAQGGYRLMYPGSWSYDESKTMVTFAPTEQLLGLPEGTALLQSPLAFVSTSDLQEMAEKLSLTDTGDPVAFAQAMAASFDAEIGGTETGQIDGYPTAYVNISGVYDGAAYRGGLAAILVDDRLVGAYIMSPPDLWGDVRSIFSNMLDSMTFFAP
ncbi:MAG: tetratricopeptide repeat protein [Anaerolineae bacterium]|nr:tetratricopeptide repeat protein [Anaerolineae bacterium]